MTRSNRSHYSLRASLCAVALCTLTFGSVGCGSAGLPRPRPVTDKLDEMFIARVPPDKRPAVSETQNEFQLARSNQMTAQDEYNKAETEVQLSRSEIDKAVIDERGAKLKQKEADASHDLTIKNQAAAEVRAAQLGRRALDKKLAYATARRDYLKMVLRFHEFEVINKESKFELEKAKVAKSNNIRPDTGFAYESFESQHKDRSASAQRAKADAERLKGKMTEREREWRAAEKEWNSARGVATPPAGSTATPSLGDAATGTPTPE